MCVSIECHHPVGFRTSDIWIRMSETPKRYEQMLCQTNGNYKYTCFHPVLERTSTKGVLRWLKNTLCAPGSFFYGATGPLDQSPPHGQVARDAVHFATASLCCSFASPKNSAGLDGGDGFRFVGHHDQSEIQKNTILTTKDFQIGQI